MTTEEFSNEFDSLINSYSGLEQFGISQNPLNFDEYEKSVFLTKAQEEIAEGLYTGKILGDSFEDTEQLRRYLSDLVKTDTPKEDERINGLGGDQSHFFKLPKDLWFITYESIKVSGKSECINGKELEVIPVTQDEFHRIKGNPFRKANSRRALRLDVDNQTVEIISEFDITEYLVRYLSKPEPIILLDLPDELTINNENKKTECKLNPGIHRMILEVAVNMAIKSRVPSTGK